MTIPPFFNIGVACTDVHLGTPAADRIAMIVEDAERGTSQLTFAQLAELTSRFAQVLRSLGVDAGERVLIRLPNCLAYPIVFLGAMKRGAIPVPSSIMLTAEEVRYLLDDAGASVLVTDSGSWEFLGDQLRGGRGLRHVILADLSNREWARSETGPSNEERLARSETGPSNEERLARSETGPSNEERQARSETGPSIVVHDLDALLAAIGQWDPPHPTRAHDPAYLVYTSGTTAFPKGVLHAHRALLGRRPAMEAWFDFHGDDHVLHSGKFNWTYVLGTAMMDPLYLGQTAIVYEGKADATRWMPLVAKHRATIFIGVPTIYRQILQKTDFSAADVPTLRHCMCAGEHLSDDVLAGWRQRFGQDIYEAIGMSECSYYMSQRKGIPIRPGSVGMLQPGHTVKLLDAGLNEVPVGEEGMIAIAENDPGLFLRYWNQPEETARLRRAGWFLTGDYARRDADGYFWFLGRRDDIIKSFGYRVSPFEVERILKDHPAVADCAVIGEGVGSDKTIIAAYVLLAPGSVASEEEIIAYATRHLASYKCPRAVHFVGDLPRTSNGKVLRRALRKYLQVGMLGNALPWLR